MTMRAQIKHLSGEDVPKAWRPTWAVCWVVELDGAVIGESAIVAAMAFVKAGFEVPPRMLVAGIPAKILRPVTDD